MPSPEKFHSKKELSRANGQCQQCLALATVLSTPLSREGALVGSMAERSSVTP